MVIKIILSCFFLMGSLTMAWATPPKNIYLSYDVLAGVLYIEAEHVSDRIDRHYLHRMEISVNGGEPQVLYYHRQVEPQGFKAEIPLAAKPTDVISVALYCIQGGSNKVELIVPEEIAK
jgi:hypothetical protein